MNLTLSTGKAIRGDLILRAAIRSDLAPIPATLEADIRADSDMRRLLAEGQTISAGPASIPFYIAKFELLPVRASQGIHDLAAVRITGLLASCHGLAFVRRQGQAIIKSDSTLSAVYRASGATTSVDGAIRVSSFACLVGGTPTYHIARALQEEGAVIRAKAGKVRAFRLQDLWQQKPVIEVPANLMKFEASGFLERHDSPSFFSVADEGETVAGNTSKARAATYKPGSDERVLRNMTRCLIRRGVARVNPSWQVDAGDLVTVQGQKKPLAVMTAAHVFRGGTDGSGADQYTRLWLGSLEG